MDFAELKMFALEAMRSAYSIKSTDGYSIEVASKESTEHRGATPKGL